MEKIEQFLDLPKINATIVARNKDNLTLLQILLLEEKAPEDKIEYGWYLNLKDPGPNRRYYPACIELNPVEFQLLQNNLKKALLKLIILENVKINGLYTLNLDGIKNLRLEVKSDGNNAWLEFVLYSSTKNKFITRFVASEVRVMHQKLQTAQAIGENLVKDLYKIQSLSESPEKHSETASTVEREKLARHLEALVLKKGELTAQGKSSDIVSERKKSLFWSKFREQP